MTSIAVPPVAIAAPTSSAPALSSSICNIPTLPGVAAAPAAPAAVAGTYGGVPLSATQVGAAQTVASVAKDMKITRRGVRIALAVALQESSLNPAAAGLTYVGLFQQKSDPVSGLYTGQDRTEAAGATRMFFQQLVARVPHYDTDGRADWEIGEVVQETGVGRNVLQWFGVAQALTDRFDPAVRVTATVAPAQPVPALSRSVGQAIVTLFRVPAAATPLVKVKAPALRARMAALVAPAPEAAGSAEAATGVPAAVPAAAVDGAAVDGTGVTASSSSAFTTAGSTATGSTATGSDASGSTATGSDASGSAGSAPATTSGATGTDAPTSPAPPAPSGDGSSDGTGSSTTPAPSSSSPVATTSPAPGTGVTSPAPATTAAPRTTAPRTSPAPAAPTTTATRKTAPATPTRSDTPPVVDTPAPPVPTGTTDDPGNGRDAPATGTDSTATTPTSTIPATLDCSTGDTGSTTFDPGMIISDAVFYNSKAMNAADIAAFLNRVGAGCSGDLCLRNLTLTTPNLPADRYCAAYQGGTDQPVAVVLAKLSVACAINPEVMLVTLQKESALLTRTNVSSSTYAAAYGWHCPDTGPGGSANCDPQYAGFFNQAAGMAKQWARYRIDPQKYNYRAGQTVNILWNVAETGCGGSSVYIRNTATASLYNYTPYQPNAASLAAYPGEGDKCSSYGNRNFFFLFQKYFGSTGGGASPNIAVNGVKVTIPSGPHVAAGAAGQVITAPSAAMARGLAAGFAAVGLPYVYGGGTNGGGADQGCARAGGAENSCQGIVGFDCSGLTGYVLKQAGRAIPDYSGAQRAAGLSVSWAQGQPGDIIGYNGHVAVYLGLIKGIPYLLEAPDVGMYLQIRPVYYSNFGIPVDSVLHRYWA